MLLRYLEGDNVNNFITFFRIPQKCGNEANSATQLEILPPVENSDRNDDSNVSCIIAKADYSQCSFGSKHDAMLPVSSMWRNTVDQCLQFCTLAD